MISPTVTVSPSIAVKEKMPYRGIVITPASGFEYPDGYQGMYYGVGPVRSRIIGDAGRTVPSNPNSFEPSKTFSVMGNFFQRLAGLDREVMSSLLEALAHSASNEYEQLDQINDSKDVNTVPTFVRKLWLQRDLVKGNYQNVPHDHLDFEYTVTGAEAVTVIAGTSYSVINLPAGEYTGDGLFLLYVNRVGVDAEAAGIKLSPGTTAGRILFPIATLPPIGSVIRLHSHIAAKEYKFTASGSMTEFVFPSPIDAVTAKVFLNNINLEEGSGWFLRQRELVFSGGASGGEVIRVQVGSNMHTVIATAGQTRVALPFMVPDAEAALVTIDGINLRTGWYVEPTRVAFGVAPRAGYIITVKGGSVAAHNHLSYALTTTVLLQQITLPVGTFDLTSTLAEDTHKPIHVWIDRFLLHTSEYVFITPNTIKFVAALPIGTKIEIKWTTSDSPAFHSHPDVRRTTVAGELAVALSVSIDAARPEYVEVNGLLMSEGEDYLVSGVPGLAIKFIAALAPGSEVLIVGQHPSYLWQFDANTSSPWDYEIVDMETIQNGIDAPSFVGVKGVDWVIDPRGVLYTNFLIQGGWIKNADVDESTAYNNFGLLLDYQEVSSAEYSSLVRALMAAYTAGSKYYVAENFSRIVLGSAYATKPGRVKSITAVTA